MGKGKDIYDDEPKKKKKFPDDLWDFPKKDDWEPVKASPSDGSWDDDRPEPEIDPDFFESREREQDAPPGQYDGDESGGTSRERARQCIQAALAILGMEPSARPAAAQGIIEKWIPGGSLRSLAMARAILSLARSRLGTLPIRFFGDPSESSHPDRELHEESLRSDPDLRAQLVGPLLGRPISDWYIAVYDETLLSGAGSAFFPSILIHEATHAAAPGAVVHDSAHEMNAWCLQGLASELGGCPIQNPARVLAGCHGS